MLTAHPVWIIPLPGGGIRLQSPLSAKRTQDFATLEYLHETATKEHAIAREEEALRAAKRPTFTPVQLAINLEDLL